MPTITIHEGTGTNLVEFEFMPSPPSYDEPVYYTFTEAETWLPVSPSPSTAGPTAEQTADVLDKAADVLETEGWGKGAYLNSETGKRCTLGAIRHAVCGNSFETASLNRASGPTILKAIHILDTYIASNDTGLSKRLGSYVSRGANFIITWNDSMNHTQEDVVNTLRKAANQAREKVA